MCSRNRLRRLPPAPSPSSPRAAVLIHLTMASTVDATAMEAPSMVPPAVVSAAEDMLAAAESVGDHLAKDPDAVLELPPLRHAHAFLAVSQAATPLFAV